MRPCETEQDQSGRRARGKRQEARGAEHSALSTQHSALRQGIALGAILLVGLILRALYLRELVDKPDFTVPAVDASFHDYWARGLATGNWQPPWAMSDPAIPQTAYLRPPGYPYFLSLVYALFGQGYLVPRVVQMGLGLVSAGLAYLFARRWFGHGVAIVLAGFVSCYWVFIYFEGEFHAPVLVIYLVWLTVYAAGAWAERLGGRHAAATGVILGVAALVRPNVLIFLPVLIVWCWWIVRRRGNRRRFALAAAGLIGGTAAAVAPATLRNYLVADDFVLISSNAGINLFAGNNEHATGTVPDRIADLGDFKTCYDYPALARNLERKLGRTLKPSEVSTYFAREAFHFMREHPGAFAKLTLKKTLLFWGPREVTHNKVVRYERAHSPTLRTIPGDFSLVVTLAVIGVALMLRGRRADEGVDHSGCGCGCPIPSVGRGGEGARHRWEMSVLLLALIVAYFVSVLPFFACARYRLPITPFLLLFAAYGTRCVCTFAMTRDLRRTVGWVCVAVVLYGAHALASRVIPGGAHDLAKWHYDRAVAYGFTGRTQQAIDEYRSVLERMPDNPHAHVGLGVCLGRRGETAQAVEHFKQALRIWPEYAEAHFYLGDAASAAGHAGEAIEHYTAALRHHPGYVEAHFKLGALFAELGRPDDAASHYLAALNINPRFAPAHRNLAVILFQRGQFVEAERHFREVVHLEPADPESYCNLAIVLTHQGRLDEAISEYRTALRVAPDHPTAREALAELLTLRRQLNPPPPGSD